MRGPTFVFEKVNPKWTELVSDREYIGKTFIEVYPGLVNTHVLQDLKMAYETGQPAVAKEIKIRMEVQSGIFDERYYDYVFTRISDSEGNPFGIYAHGKNVTERILIRKRLEESIDDLGEERDLREKFVAALSHDLRTPLTAAKMCAQMLSRNMPDPLQLLKIPGRIVDNMDRADIMIRDLLDVGRIKAGENLPLNIMKCDLSETIKQTAVELASLHGDRFVLKGKEEIYGFWDCTAIRRVVENLANNAVY